MLLQMQKLGKDGWYHVLLCSLFAQSLEVRTSLQAKKKQLVDKDEWRRMKILYTETTTLMGGEWQPKWKVTSEFSLPKNCIVQGIVLLEFRAGTEKWRLDFLISFFQAEDTNPYYDSVYMESNMDTRVKDNNPVYGNN